jgi:hypothetical protein
MAKGTKDEPWVLKTPPGFSEYSMYRDETADPPQLVCQVGSTKLTYQLRAIGDLHTWLKELGNWVPLGATDEQKVAAEGTVEAWGRSPDNPVGGWYGLRTGYRGRLRYSTHRVDELTFVHVAIIEGTTNPLDDVAASRAFTEGIAARCEEPQVAHGELLGSYPATSPKIEVV